ncbi:MAG: hypothetical protein QG608_1441 [Actinomycetota bacterium]|nr:hypothetical protein [Actinomycetota bacterium]
MTGEDSPGPGDSLAAGLVLAAGLGRGWWPEIAPGLLVLDRWVPSARRETGTGLLVWAVAEATENAVLSARA